MVSIYYFYNIAVRDIQVQASNRPTQSDKCHPGIKLSQVSSHFHVTQTFTFLKDPLAEYLMYILLKQKLLTI